MFEGKNDERTNVEEWPKKKTKSEARNYENNRNNTNKKYGLKTKQKNENDDVKHRGNVFKKNSVATKE